MNCCNHNCNQGRNCPVRESRVDMPVMMLDKEPPVSFDSCMRYFGAFCAGAGFVAACIAAGLYFGG